MKLELFRPVDPYHVNQGFAANPGYYARFHDALGKPEKGHMGIDLMAAHGQPVYAAVDGQARYVKDEHGGEGVYIFTGPYDYQGGTCWFNIINWHLVGDTDPNFPKPFDSQSVKAGDLIGYADNTGAPFESSGDHLHLGLQPVDSRGKPILIDNGFGGCIDPAPYLNQYYAKNAQSTLLNLRLQLSTLQKIIPLLRQLIGL